MPAPLLPIEILSIYFKHNQRLNLPEDLARCTPDLKKAVLNVRDTLGAMGVDLFLSDMFRSHDLQLQAHIDNAKKGINSPLPGGSMHEAGRAFDLDLEALLKDNALTLADFWNIAKANNLSPIISEPDPDSSEAWHFECRGSHAIVRQYYNDGKASNMPAYTAMAASAIVSVGIKVDRFQNQNAARIQSALIRMGHTPGPLDGVIGNKTRNALTAAGIAATAEADIVAALEDRLRQTFPEEFET
jgi:hypothetical protein